MVVAGRTTMRAVAMTRKLPTPTKPLIVVLGATGTGKSQVCLS